MLLGTLEFSPVFEREDLISASIRDALRELPRTDEVFVAKIDPTLSDTAAFCAEYDVPLEQAGKCVIIEASRGEKRTHVACVVLATARIDVNGVVRKTLDARRASFATMEDAVSLSKMEYGAISPIGLPLEWPILIDTRVVAKDQIIIGSGIRGSKLLVPGTLLSEVASVQVIEDLAR